MNNNSGMNKHNHDNNNIKMLNALNEIQQMDIANIQHNSEVNADAVGIDGSNVNEVHEDMSRLGRDLVNDSGRGRVRLDEDEDDGHAMRGKNADGGDLIEKASQDYKEESTLRQGVDYDKLHKPLIYYWDRSSSSDYCVQLEIETMRYGKYINKLMAGRCCVSPHRMMFIVGFQRFL